ncbi:nuclease-related domain-containing protein [uncultured Cocleimonas sp.]|uniref:nuclease-related domain-containing protein n=1 Tax=uncultured Cocleimonas sp. TaxID=1051587 RepID=UPI0026320593|nr:nuclease-related domain-containing protein [uncultured Cocleimonas sp.]
MHYLIISALIAILAIYLNSPAFKGLIEGPNINQSIIKNLNKNEYHLINDISMPALSGTTQIDHLLVSPYGIFVVDTKYMKGWIFGGEHEKDWVQSTSSGKFKFQNPLHKNHKHIKALAHMLDLTDDKFHSIIAFTGNSSFKTTMPENVLDVSYIEYIKSIDTVIFPQAEVKNLIESIELLKIERPRSTTKKQVAYLRQPYRV